MNDAVGFDRNAGVARNRRIPRGRTVSRRECLRVCPGIDGASLTGGAIFYDAQVYNSERLLIAFLRSAAKAGAELANYVEVTGVLSSGGHVTGVAATDRLTGEELEIRGRVVVNATGPWTDRLLDRARPRAAVGLSFATAINVVTRQLFPSYAVALATDAGHRDRDALVRRGNRLLFVVPWRERSLVGTFYAPYTGVPEDFAIAERDVVRLLQDVNRACPPLQLSLDDVSFVHGGLVPMDSIDPMTGDPQLAKHGRLVHHAADGLRGLVSVVGVKYTTARLAAERAVDKVFEILGRTPPPALSGVVPLHGGDAPPVTHALDEASPPHRVAKPLLDRLVRNYGSAYPEVLAYAAPGAIDAGALVRAETCHAIRCEMAHTLGDVVFRRTELCTAGDPGAAVLDGALRTAAAELQWTDDRAQRELGHVHARLRIPR